MKNIIPLSQAIEMRNDYQHRVAPRLKTDPNYAPTDFAWIDLEALKNYVELLDGLKGKNGEKISGVRIYFSSYPEAAAFASTGTAISLPGREAVFFNPTVKVESTTESQSYPNLEHLPVCVMPHDPGKPYEGEFYVLRGLTNAADNSVYPDGGDLLTGTSLAIDSLYLTPPPKK